MVYVVPATYVFPGPKAGEAFNVMVGVADPPP